MRGLLPRIDTENSVSRLNVSTREVNVISRLSLIEIRSISSRFPRENSHSAYYRWTDDAPREPKVAQSNKQMDKFGGLATIIFNIASYIGHPFSRSIV